MTLVKRNTDKWLPSLLDDMFKTEWMEDSNAGMNRIGINVPAVNIAENDDEYSLELAAPGKSKDAFNLELDNGVLTISSEDKSESEEKENGGRYTRREFSYSSFKRAFSLPKAVDTERIEAAYTDGVLNIKLPKREEAKVQAKKMIEIQ